LTGGPLQLADRRGKADWLVDLISWLTTAQQLVGGPISWPNERAQLAGGPHQLAVEAAAAADSCGSSCASQC